MTNITRTRRPGRYARTKTALQPDRHVIEISAGPGCASYGLLKPGGALDLWPAATALAHIRRPVAF